MDALLTIDRLRGCVSKANTAAIAALYLSESMSYPKPEEVLLSDLLQLFNDPQAKPAWRKPWTATAQSQHKNLVTGAEYSGANPLVLELYAALRGHTTPLWLGSGQAKKIGCFPKKGSKAARILRPQLNQYEKTDDRWSDRAGCRRQCRDQCMGELQSDLCLQCVRSARQGCKGTGCT